MTSSTFFSILEINIFKFSINKLIHQSIQSHQLMVKSEKQGEKIQNKSNKTHKTLRQKLRKKREQQKKHKKEKSEQKKQYNAQEQKLKFFTQGVDKQDNNGKQLKLKKINKCIQKFINIYEDDLEQFYDMFKTFDEGGFIDISGLQNKELQKCIKKLFKYLPIKKQNGEYKKVEGAKIGLQKFIKNKVSQSIQNYLQIGSVAAQDSNQQSSQDQNEHKKKSKKHRGNKAVKAQQDEKPEQLRLYKQSVIQQPTQTMGPYIPPQVREQMAKMFQQELIQRQKQKQLAIQAEEDEFTKIFSSGKTRKEMKQYSTVKEGNAVPEHLMALGSALIGEKVQIDDNEIEEYNKIYRPKKLIDLHKELKQTITQEDPNKRKPFDRQRDVLGSGKMGLMSNSTFFDFKSRMSKPKNTNQFL